MCSVNKAPMPSTINSADIIADLLENFGAVSGLSVKEKELNKKFFNLKKVRRKQYLLQEGDVCRHIVFVNRGALRSYIVDKHNKEHITNFAIEGDAISDFESFFLNTPSRCNIDALEDSELFLIEKQSREEILVRIPQFERILRLMLETQVTSMQQRITSILSESIEDRYTSFSKTYPHLLHRVPQHMIASFLGVSPSFLSRILARKVNNH